MSDQSNLNKKDKPRNSREFYIQENKNPHPENIPQINYNDGLQVQNIREESQAVNSNILYQFQNPNQAKNSNISYQVQNPNNTVQAQNQKYPLQPQFTGNINGSNGDQMLSYLLVYNTVQLTQLNIEALNIKILKFLNTLGNYSKVKILCNKQCCGASFRSIRSYKVIGINEQGEENIIMTASQEQINCFSEGYMLVYRINETVIGALGYQYNRDCCDGCSCGGCFCGGGGGCCENCCECKCNCCDCSNCCKCDDCCCCELCKCCNDCCKCGKCCNDCCKCGKCCKDGCCCCSTEGCCESCCEKGCCCCPEYCCYCPSCKTILLDLRFLNTIQEALNVNSGLYVCTFYNPFNCFRCSPEFIGHEKCGEKFAIDNKCISCYDTKYNIIDVRTKENIEIVGNIKQTKTCFCDVQSFDIDFPKDAFPLEKLLIISEVFMLVFLKWDEDSKNRMILTKKFRFNPGLNPDFC